MSLDEKLLKVLEKARDSSGLIVFLTGAGVSAESGIPTFRGEEGYWTHGSQVYRPEELARWSTFASDPELVWPWYLYRRSICRDADPNPAHMALACIEDELGDRFALITQNVDGLHLRAGNTLQRTWQIHGNIDYMRCSRACNPQLFPMPDIRGVAPGSSFDHAWKAQLSCPMCGSWARPHVLWFDESYDEANYRYHSSRQAAFDACLLVVAGTSGATNLPNMVAEICLSRGTPIIDINPQENTFTSMARRSQGGWLQAPATEGLKWIEDVLGG